MKIISIVVPVFNEEDNIQHFYESICQNMEPLPYEFELIFVDDGSKDRSREILRELEKKDSRIQSWIMLKVMLLLPWMAICSIRQSCCQCF